MDSFLPLRQLCSLEFEITGVFLPGKAYLVEMLITSSLVPN